MSRHALRPVPRVPHSALKAAALLDMMKEHIAGEAGEDLKKKIGDYVWLSHRFVYQFNISPKKIGIDPEVYVVDLKNSKVTKGEPKEKPDAAFSFVDDDFVAVATGKLGPQMAFVRCCALRAVLAVVMLRLCSGYKCL
eukprot:jgi/Mesvir1/13135/Mv24060-RA.1